MNIFKYSYFQYVFKHLVLFFLGKSVSAYAGSKSTDFNYKSLLIVLCISINMFKILKVKKINAIQR